MPKQGVILGMFARCLFVLFVVLAVGACANLKKKPYAEADKKKHEAAGASAQDVSFQAFLGTLREAIAAKDIPQLASMMTPDFGYRWDSAPAGENVFRYWDENGVWPELQAMIKLKFQPYQDFMVAPVQFANDSANYHGYRLGIRRIDGAWKFVYFVSDEQH